MCSYPWQCVAFSASFLFSASSAPSPASLHITLLQHFQGEDRDAGAPQSKHSVAWTCLTAWPVLSLGSVQVDSTTRASCYAFVCRQLLVWLIVWPSSDLNGHMSWKSRMKGWGEKGRLRGVWSESTFSCLAVVLWQVTRKLQKLLHQCSFTGGKTEACRRVYPARSLQIKLPPKVLRPLWSLLLLKS